MKIAIPTANGTLCPHFGHCESFALLEVDKQNKAVLKRDDLVPPPHEPGLLPRWLQERGVTMVIAGGMGHRAQEFFTQMGIEVLVGAPSQDPEDLARSWMDGTLALGGNVCDH